MIETPIYNKCNIVPICKRRDGGTRYWCLAHKADSTAKYGKRGKHCRYAHIPPVLPGETFEVSLQEYPGGLGMWGAVPPVYDTTLLPIDKGVHVHARKSRVSRKEIDKTFRQVIVSDGYKKVTITELDAIYFLASAVFGFHVCEVHCTRCGYSHLDRDWFSVHPHQSHLCAGCGRNFRDSIIGVGNPVAELWSMQGVSVPRLKKDNKTCVISQNDFKGGIQIWGANPAFLWTSNRVAEDGIHLHAYKENSFIPTIDDTFSSLTIDGMQINARQVQYLMVQNVLPHINNRIKSLSCQRCNTHSFDQLKDAFTPRVGRRCTKCKSPIRAIGGLKKVISNPLISTLEKLSTFAVRPPRKHDLDLLPETL